MQTRLLFLAAVVAAAVSGLARAQWSTDPAVNLAIGDRTGEQNQAKIRATADGGCWISWYDNAAGGYDVYVQRLDAAGNEMLPHNGVLVRDTGFSSTQDYDLRVDAAGNAVLAFRDDRIVPGSVQVVLQKVAPNGTLLLGATGVRVSTIVDANNPKCAVLSDGAVAVSWSGGGSPSTVFLQRVSANNTLEFANPVVVSEASRALSNSDLQAAENGNVILLYVRCGTGNCVTSNKHLYAQKFDAGGAPLWDRDPANATPADLFIVFDGTSIQNGTFPFFIPDGSGGGIFGWYETGASRRAYVQHIGAGGEELFGHNGLPAMLLGAGALQISAGLSYDASSGDAYLVAKTANTNQNMWGIRAAKITSEGVRAWGDEGAEVLPMTGVQTSFERSLVRSGGGCDLYWFENATSPPGGRVLGFALDGTGAPAWPGIIDVCSIVGSKARLDVARGTRGNAMVSWADSRADTNSIFAQSVLPVGDLGPPPAGCSADFNQDGSVNGDDLGDYINCYFAAPPCPQAETNGDGEINSDDLADFINTFFGPAC